jgi:hypothetical protein
MEVKIWSKIGCKSAEKVFSKIFDFLAQVGPILQGWRILGGIFPGKSMGHPAFLVQSGKFRAEKKNKNIFLKYFYFFLEIGHLLWFGQVWPTLLA